MAFKSEPFSADATSDSVDRNAGELSEDARAALRLASEALRGLTTLQASEQQRVAGLVAMMAVALVSKADAEAEQTNTILERIEAVTSEARRRA